jgi:predicted glycosyltransferase
MSYASLVFGESASMAAEASYLGTPSIFIDNVGRGYTDELSKFDLLYHFTESSVDQEKSIEKAKEILLSKDKQRWILNAEKLSHDKIDVGSFINWFVKEYPRSKKIMFENPGYQENFKNSL